MGKFQGFYSLKIGLVLGSTLLLGCVPGPTLRETRRGESLPGPNTTLSASPRVSGGILSITAIVIAVFGTGFSLLGIIGGVFF